VATATLAKRFHRVGFGSSILGQIDISANNWRYKRAETWIKHDEYGGPPGFPSYSPPTTSAPNEINDLRS